MTFDVAIHLLVSLLSGLTCGVTAARARQLVGKDRALAAALAAFSGAQCYASLSLTMTPVTVRTLLGLASGLAGLWYVIALYRALRNR